MLRFIFATVVLQGIIASVVGQRGCPEIKCSPKICPPGFELQPSFITFNGVKCTVCPKCVRIPECPPIKCPLPNCGPNGVEVSTTFEFEDLTCPGCPRCLTLFNACPIPVCAEVPESCPSGEELVVSAFIGGSGRICDGCLGCKPECEPLDCPDEPEVCETGELIHPDVVQNFRRCPGCAICSKN